jgi:hypothetical protein
MCAANMSLDRRRLAFASCLLQPGQDAAVARGLRLIAARPKLPQFSFEGTQLAHA